VEADQPCRSATIGTPRDSTVKPRYGPPATAPIGVAAPVARLIAASPVTPPTVSVANARLSLALMSKPTASEVSRPSPPTGTSVPLLGGFWMKS
jgi:hypothetical protein